MRGFNDPVIKMLRFGRNIAGMLSNFSHRRAGTITATSFVASAFVYLNDNRNKRKLGELNAENEILIEKARHIKTTFGDHEKEFIEFLGWKTENMKAWDQRLIYVMKRLGSEPVEGNVLLDDTFTVTRQGDTLTVTGQGDTFTIAWQGGIYTITENGETFTFAGKGRAGGQGRRAGQGRVN